jgi:hypothetical protein
MVLPTVNPTKSYWIEAAESPLRNFRSSDKLPEETDVAIIGCGYGGSTTAYWIDKVRHQIAYIDLSPSALTELLVYSGICKAASSDNFRSARHLRIGHRT